MGKRIKMNKQKELELKKRFWITKKQLNNLFLLEHKKTRETLINEIIKNQNQDLPEFQVKTKKQNEPCFNCRTVVTTQIFYNQVRSLSWFELEALKKVIETEMKERENLNE